MNPKQDAFQIFNAAIASVQPAQLLPWYLAVDNNNMTIADQVIPFHSFQNIYIIGAGKASAAMAVATENIIGDYITRGLIITKYNHALPCKKIKVTEGAHPVPDENCVNAVKQTIQLLQQVTAKDIVLCLISGGASALWCDVPVGLTLAEVQTTFDKLIKSGATIGEINTVRKHLSSVKGGQLIKHCNGARVFAFIISDVPGDDISVIASGPTVGDASTFNDAFAVLAKYDFFHQLPNNIQTYINKGLEGSVADTPKSNDPLFQFTTNFIIGSNATAIRAAAKQAATLGFVVCVNDKLITGGCEEEAKKFSNNALAYIGEKPVCFIQGGETILKVTGSGKGGRNQHFVLSSLYELCKEQHFNNNTNILVLSGGTDGTDGPTDATGAIADINTCQFAEEKHLSIEDYLHNHDAYHFFEQTNGLIITGATQTNVMDIMLAIVY